MIRILPLQTSVKELSVICKQNVGVPRKRKILYSFIVFFTTECNTLHFLEMFLFSSHLFMLFVYYDANYLEMLQKLHVKM